MIFLGLCKKLLCCIVCVAFLLNGENICGESDNIDDNYAIVEDVDAPSGETITENIVEEVIEEFKFIKPISGGVITSKYGMRNGKLHTGIDIADSLNTEIGRAHV